MTPRAAPRLARMPFFTVHDSDGICRQPSSDLPLNIFATFGGNGAVGGGIEPMLAIDSCVVGAVVAIVEGALDCANAAVPPVMIKKTATAAMPMDLPVEVRFM